MRKPTEPKPIKMSEFTIRVLALIKNIPRGNVATYGQIAALAGKPHGARGVGWILNSCSKTHRLPWQRVINSQGKISFALRTEQFRDQKKLLMKEGVSVSDSGAVRLDLYGWKKKPKAVRAGCRGSLHEKHRLHI